MNYLIIGLKLIVGLSILNVWILRFGQSTQWRGSSAETMKEDFEAYGLPEWFLYLIGAAKVILALVLLASVYYNYLTPIGAYGIAFLMLGAIVMHIKIKDPLKKSLPAFIFLVLSLATVFLPGV